MPSADGSPGPLIEREAGTRTDRHWPDAGCSRIPNWVYTDPELFAREQERIFAGPSWLYVCLEAEIPKPGDFKRSRLGTSEVVAVRGTDGEIRVLVNRCAHRSAQFCSAPAARPRSSSAPITNGPTISTASCSACRSAAAFAARAACPPISAPRSTGCSASRSTVAARRRLRQLFERRPNRFEGYLGRHHARLFRPGVRRPRAGRARLSAPAHSEQLEADVREHQGPLSRQPAARVPGDLRAVPARPAIRRSRWTRPGGTPCWSAARGEQQANEATAQMRAFKPDFALRDPRLLEPVREFPGDATVVMQTLWPNLIVQQQSNTLAMRQIVPLDAGQFDLVWTFFGYADDTAGDAPAPAAPGQSDRARRALSRSTTARRCCCRRPGSTATTTANASSRWAAAAVHDAPHMVTETAIRGFYQHYRRGDGL